MRELLDIRQRGLCPCGHARRLLADKLEAIDAQLTSLAALRRDVEALIAGGVAEDAQEWWPCAKPVVQLESRTRRRTS